MQGRRVVVFRSLAGVHAAVCKACGRHVAGAWEAIRQERWQDGWSPRYTFATSSKPFYFQPLCPLPVPNADASSGTCLVGNLLEDLAEFP